MSIKKFNTPLPPKPDSNAPKTLTVILADTNRTYVAITMENEWLPYSYRTIQIQLTDKQRAALEPRLTGYVSGIPRYEEISTVFFEPCE